MGFSSYDELKAAVAKRRQSLLTLEIDMGDTYSEEHEQAKADLQQAEGMRMIFDGLGGNNIDELKQRVADTRPESNSIFIQFKKLDLDEWKRLITTKGLDAFGQYERVLPQTFVGLFGEDPVRPEELGEDDEWVPPIPLTTSPLSVSAAGGAESVLAGGSLHSVVQTFINWQNSGGEVNIRPTKSGRA